MRKRVRYRLHCGALKRIVLGESECRRIESKPIEVVLDRKRDALVIDGVTVPCIYSANHAHKPTAMGILTCADAPKLFDELVEDMKDPRRSFSEHYFSMLQTARDMVLSFREMERRNEHQN